MTQPRRAYQDKKGDRWYYSFDPHSRYYGVTSAISVLDKPWLCPWYAKEVAETAVEFMMDMAEFSVSIKRPFNESYIYPFWSPPGDVDWEDLAKLLAQAPTLVRDSAGERGDAIHDYLKDLMEFSKGHAKKARAYYEEHPPNDAIDSWVAPVLYWLDENEVEVIECEATLYNDTHGYAGSCDLIARVGDTVRYIDYKTSGTISDTFALQVAAYAHCEYIISDTDQRKDVPDEDVEGGILWIGDGTCKFVDIDISEDMFDAFLSCLLVKRLWSDGSSKEAIGRVLWKYPKSGRKRTAASS